MGANLTPPVTTIREQASEEQQAYWMPKILNYDIIGCYAQTELGHGSNVRGLETTATWDPERKEFEIHSPYLTASKWWNGSMGRTATHAVRHFVPRTGTQLQLISFLDCGCTVTLAEQRKSDRLYFSRPANIPAADSGCKDSPTTAWHSRG